MSLAAGENASLSASDARLPATGAPINPRSAKVPRAHHASQRATVSRASMAMTSDLMPWWP